MNKMKRFKRYPHSLFKFFMKTFSDFTRFISYWGKFVFPGYSLFR